MNKTGDGTGFLFEQNKQSNVTKFNKLLGFEGREGGITRVFIDISM